MPRMTKRRTRQREWMETVQVELVMVLMDLDEVILRTQQAVQRTAMVADVLDPSLKRLARIHKSLRLIKRTMDGYWEEADKHGWR